MKSALSILFFTLTTYFSSAQSATKIEWSDFEIVGSKKVSVEFFGSKTKIDWPVFSKDILKLNDSLIQIEGYYHCMESTNLETMDRQKVCILAIAKKPTIEVCGVPQYRNTEFLRIPENTAFPEGEKLMFEGVLHIHQDASEGNLISLKNSFLVH